MEEFLDFVATLRTNNWNIPVLVGGDFNMDMKSYDLSPHPHLNIVPYRSDPETDLAELNRIYSLSPPQASIR